MPTTLRLDGDPVPLPPPVALAAYRIVQESLTNVVRHACGVSSTVSVVHEDGSLLVDVVNESGTGPATFGDGAGRGAGRDEGAGGGPGRDPRRRAVSRRRLARARDAPDGWC